MVKIAFKIYAVIAILAPWAFLFARFQGWYNFPQHNSQIFLGLFVYSGIMMVLTYKKW